MNDKYPVFFTPGHMLVDTEILAKSERVLDIEFSASFTFIWVQVSDLRDLRWRFWRNEVFN